MITKRLTATKFNRRHQAASIAPILVILYITLGPLTLQQSNGAITVPAPLPTNVSDPNSISRNDNTQQKCGAGSAGKLYIRTLAGMSNRLRGLSAILHAAQLADIPLENLNIIWRQEKRFIGNWSDFFEDRGFTFAPRTPDSCCRVWPDCPDVKKLFEWSDWLNASAPWLQGGCQKDLCLWTDTDFGQGSRGYKKGRDFFDSIKLSPDIKKEIKHFKASQNWTDWGQWVGVHIRRTDLKIESHVKAVDAIQLDSYVQVAKYIINRSANVRFFVATDDPSAEEEFIQGLGELGLTKDGASRVSIYPKPVRDAGPDVARAQLGGIREGVIDQFLLSEAGLLIGTTWSSYSEVAARLGNIYNIEVGPGEFTMSETDREVIETAIKPAD